MADLPIFVHRDNLIIASPLSSSEKLVLLVLNRRIGSKEVCWPSIKRIAKDTSLSRSTIKRYLKFLTADGILTHHGFHPNSIGTATIQYGINTDRLVELIAEGNKVVHPEPGFTVDPGSREDSGVHREPISRSTVNHLVGSGRTHPRFTVNPEHPNVLQRSPQTTSGGLGMTSSTRGVGEKDDEVLHLDSSLVPFLKDLHYQGLIRVVEAATAGHSLGESKHDRKHLAKQLTELLNSLPKGFLAEDVVMAIDSKEFEGLRNVSWGLLLSPNYSDRFGFAIKKAIKTREDNTSDEKRQRLKISKGLSSLDSGERFQAIDRMMSYYDGPALAAKIKRVIEEDSVLENRQLALSIVYKCNGKLTPADRRGLAAVCTNQLPISDGEFKTELEYAISELGEAK